MSLTYLLNGHKLPTLFIGSGISRRYINLPNWDELLETIYCHLDIEDFDYQYFKAKIRNTIENSDLSGGEFNALVASKLEIKFNKYYYESDLFKEYPEWGNANVSPFKMCIASKLKKYEISEEKREEVKWLKKLRGKVHSIITTNYDTFIEDLFEFKEESIFVGQHELFNANSVEIDELFKLHGCVTKPKSILITKQDYHHYAEHAKLFSAKLMTLISENPIVFIGYSIQDANVQETLTNLVSCLTNEQINELSNHFYIVNYKHDESELVESQYMFNAKSYDGQTVTFPVTVITTDNYLNFYKQLYLLNPAMNISVVKQVKRIIRDIVIKSTESNKDTEPILTVMLDDLDQSSTDDYNKLAIALGDIKQIKDFGYGVKPKVEVFEDILLNNKHLDSKRLLMGTYENHYLKIRTNIPIYKYVKEVQPSVIENLERVNSYTKEKGTVNSYLNQTLIRNLQTIPVGDTLKDIPADYETTRRKRYLWIFKNIENLDNNEIKDFLIEELQIYEDFESYEKSDFHRLISMYDLLKYKNNPKECS